MRLLIVFSLSIFFFGCTSNQIIGLWQVDKVEVGEEEMTPIARWVDFDKDNSQKSGNGWSHHSIGTWDFDPKTNGLNITNTNGYLDSFGPFEISITQNQMEWTRVEDGMEVRVFLSKVMELPTAPADLLLGVWDLEQVTENGMDKTMEYDPNGNRYLFIRWDKIFNVRNSPEGRKSGVYQVHSHRNELLFVYYGKGADQERWRFEIDNSNLTLYSINRELETTIKYNRTDHFLE